MESRTNEEQEGAAWFPLCDDDKPGIDAICTLIRAKLNKMRPAEIRSAAIVLLALERLPAATPGVQIHCGFFTPSADGNYVWADIDIDEHEFRLGLGEHFYDPAIGGDTETRTVFETQSGSHWREGDIDDWLPVAISIASRGNLSIEDNSDFEGIEWELEPRDV